MDALAVLECLETAQMCKRPGDMDAQQRDTVDRRLRKTRRDLLAAVGGNAPPGFDAFSNMISAHWLCVYKE